MNINLKQYPLLKLMSHNALWLGQDDFPSCDEWADESEKWLHFVENTGALTHYLPRLRGPKERRDEALHEIAVVYFLVKHCGLSILEWEPIGREGKKGEALVGLPDGGCIFVEVKSPGWEAEIVKSEGRQSNRLKMKKYINLETRFTDPWRPVRDSVAKAYPKMLDSMPSLLIIHDDLVVQLHSWLSSVDIALYCERGKGVHTSGYLVEDGCFVGRQYERLGAVGIFNVALPSGGIKYSFSLFDNPNSLDTTKVPFTVFGDYPRSDGRTRLRSKYESAG